MSVEVMHGGANSSLMEPRLTDLDFGQAIYFLKQGKKLAREGWNGKGMFLYYVPANSYPAITDIAKAEFGDTVPYGWNQSKHRCRPMTKYPKSNTRRWP